MDDKIDQIKVDENVQITEADYKDAGIVGDKVGEIQLGYLLKAIGKYQKVIEQQVTLV